MHDDRIIREDPRSGDITALLARHLEFAHAHSPGEDVHALDVDALAVPAILFFSFRRDGVLLGVGALRLLDDHHGELKAMHTAASARGQGVGGAMVAHLLQTAREIGLERVSLETGAMDAFAPARSLYTRYGFEVCAPFADYVESPNSTCMTLELNDAERRFD